MLKNRIVTDKKVAYDDFNVELQMVTGKNIRLLTMIVIRVEKTKSNIRSMFAMTIYTYYCNSVL